ncbi:MAG TPA: hypothetical protein VFR93_09550 [Candidatus Limnocylindrales bacterium]|jgi:hypothetical protein|nr:hypothetical protein [Candidatus Limnocylindrales bacterium]
MESFIAIVGTGTVLIVFTILSALFGVDSRDGFTEPTYGNGYR